MDPRELVGNCPVCGTKLSYPGDFLDLNEHPDLEDHWYCAVCRRWFY